MDMKLEVVVVPVSDVDRAKDFYKRLGFREDIDYVGSDGYRVVQLTPPGSACSIIFGKGVTSAQPGSIDRLRPGGARHRRGPRRAPRARRRGSACSTTPAVASAAAFTPTPRRAPRVQIPNAVPTPRMPRSAIPTATAGCCRRSRSGSRAGCDRWTSRRLHSSCMKRPNVTVRSRRSPHRTTGGTGTRRTWTLASAGAPRRRPPRPLVATWRRSSTLSSRQLDVRPRVEALLETARGIWWPGGSLQCEVEFDNGEATDARCLAENGKPCSGVRPWTSRAISRKRTLTTYTP